MSDPITELVKRRKEEQAAALSAEAIRQETKRRKANEPIVARIRAEATAALQRLADKDYPDAELVLVWNDDDSTQEMACWLIYYRVQYNYHSDMDEWHDQLFLLSDGSIGWHRVDGFKRIVLEEAPNNVLTNALAGLEKLVNQ